MRCASYTSAENSSQDVIEKSPDDVDIEVGVEELTQIERWNVNLSLNSRSFKLRPGSGRSGEIVCHKYKNNNEQHYFVFNRHLERIL